MGPCFVRVGPLDDTGSGHVLWGPHPGQKRALDNDAQLLPYGTWRSAIWFVYGFSLSFGPDAFGGLLGGLQHFGLSGVGGAPWPDQTIPGATFMIFQCMFAIITPALISGRICRTYEVQFVHRIHGLVDDFRLLPSRSLGLGPWRLACKDRRPGFCRRHGGAHQFRCGGSGMRSGDW